MMDQIWQFLGWFAAIAAVCLVVALLGLALIARQIRQLRVPRDADFFTTMRHVPLALVILLDLLDFSLDIFSAPIIWLALDRMGLPNLRNKAVVEALVPFTNVIPTFTVGWVAARALNLGTPPGAYSPYRPDYERPLPDGRDATPYAPEARTGRRTIDMDP
ncbi:MAG: hypothetical protein H7Y32_04810 [Chloroflexales bacterium]|nr:hypothetical protein [Chloroflexales bacterium]